MMTLTMRMKKKRRMRNSGNIDKTREETPRKSNRRIGRGEKERKERVGRRINNSTNIRNIEERAPAQREEQKRINDEREQTKQQETM